MSHRKRRTFLRSTNRLVQIENLEPRVVLGSMVPTETGTFVGELVPIESVNILTSDAEPGDIALRELKQTTEEVKADLNWLDRMARERQAQREARTQQDVQQAQYEAERQELDGKQSEAGQKNDKAEKEATPKPNRVILDLTQTKLRVDSSQTDSEGDQWDSCGDSCGADDEIGSNGIDEDEHASTNLPDDESQQHRNQIAAENAQEQGSRDQKIQSNLTFAVNGSPSDLRQYQGNGRLPSFAGGLGGRHSGNVEAVNQAVQDALARRESPSTGITFGNPIAPTAGRVQTLQTVEMPSEPVVIRYDFRNIGEHQNVISSQEVQAAENAMQGWTSASEGMIQFVQDSSAADSEIVNFGKGDLAAFGIQSDPGGTLALGGGTPIMNANTGGVGAAGIAWLDRAESWDTNLGNGDAAGTYDAFTVFAHEIGHALGGADASPNEVGDIMNGVYDFERGEDAIETALQNRRFAALDPSTLPSESSADFTTYEMHAMVTGYPQITASEVEFILDLATQVTPSEDAIIAVVDRGGNILGVRIEDGVPASAISTPETLSFSIDGAVAKARTAAFFANGDPTNGPEGTFAPITSRLVRFISQSTVTLREVNSNPNVSDEFLRGPGLVAPIGLGGHFPPEVLHTPPVDLFAIEQTNRDSVLHPGEDEIKGTADDIMLMNRFNIDPAFVPEDSNGDGVADNPDFDGDGNFDLQLNAPESYGFVTGILPSAQARGIATLPGGVPLYRDTNGDGFGDTIVGAVGVFFPGPDGFASFEQGFVEGIGQSERDRTNAPRVLEAEFIATIAAGGSLGAELGGPRTGGFSPTPGAKVPGHPFDIPFGRLDLVGIQLEVIGPTSGVRGVRELLDFGRGLGLLTGAVNGTNQVIDAGADNIPGTGDEATTRDGQFVPFGWLVTPHDGGDFDGDGNPDVTAADVMQIINDGVAEANRVRAAIRLPLSSRTRMVLSVTDLGGEVLGLFRMQDATIFSIDVAVAKARNVAYYADPAAGVLQLEDRVQRFENPNVVPVGTAITNRTIRFLSEPRFPSGVDGSEPGDFSILHDINDALGGATPLLGRNEKIALVESSAPISVNQFNSANGTVLGHNSFFPSTNFRDPGDGMVATGDPTNDRVRHQNGIVFFPGSTPIYRNGELIGGFGVSGDGVDQDDVVTFNGAGEFLPGINTPRADETFVDGVRLPYIKFLRNPRG